MAAKSDFKHTTLLSEIKKRNYKPVYFLMGEEPYFIDLITGYIMDTVLTEDQKVFNQTVVYGKDANVPSIISAARRFPMNAERQVIVVKEAQDIKDIDELLVYVENPMKSTILVINYKYKTFDKRKKLYKAVKAKGEIFESARLYENQVPDWISGYLKLKKKTIEPKAAILLTEFLGAELSKIANELDKLIITLPESETQITSHHIEKNIGISKDYNNFELNKALSKKDSLKAMKIADYFSKNQKNHPIRLSIVMLYLFFSKVLLYHSLKDKSKNNAAMALKVNPFFVAEYEMAAKKYNMNKVAGIIGLLRKYDMKSMGVGSTSIPSGELFRELVFKILH